MSQKYKDILILLHNVVFATAGIILKKSVIQSISFNATRSKEKQMKVDNTVASHQTTGGGNKPSPETKKSADFSATLEKEQQVQAASTGGGVKRPPDSGGGDNPPGDE